MRNKIFVAIFVLLLLSPIGASTAAAESPWKEAGESRPTAAGGRHEQFHLRAYSPFGADESAER